MLLPDRSQKSVPTVIWRHSQASVALMFFSAFKAHVLFFNFIFFESLFRVLD